MRVKIDDYTRGEFVELNGDAWRLTSRQMKAIKHLILYCLDGCNTEQDMRDTYHPVGDDVTPGTVDLWMEAARLGLPALRPFTNQEMQKRW